MIRFLISIPVELRDELRKAAREEGFTLNGFIRKLLWDWRNDRKDKASA